MSTEPGQVSSPARPARPHPVLRSLEFVHYVGREFLADGCPRAAAGLAYTTLLAVVPLLTVAFVSLSAFPAFQDLGDQIEGFVFSNFVPTLSDTVRSYMHEFAYKAAGLRALGLAVLFVTVLGLMATVDSALNDIWHVRGTRRRLVSFLVYWAVLTLGPLLVGTGLAVSSYLISLPLLSDVETSLGLRVKALVALPYATSFLAFLLLYTFVPNRPVRLRHAVVGAVTATVLFELGKRGFALYVTHFPSHQAIYGAFAAIPVFQIWIYLCWLIVLFGAEITRCGASFNPVAIGPAAEPGGFLDGYRILARLAGAQRSGLALAEDALHALEPTLGDRRLSAILERLTKAHWIARTETGGWVLTRDLDTLTLLDLYRTVPGPLPGEDLSFDDAPAMGRLAAVLGEYRTRAEAAMSVPLATLLAD
ncbi:MAG: YihY family inner membrane protein [Gammaproteobacteria bacterium]|nr:YihY family inner membrane protein [Gammaproteobacteria bacterium]